MDKYIEAEKQAAEALGWVGVTMRMTTPDAPLGGTPPQLQDPQHPDYNTIYRWHSVPKWCRDDGAAFRLMVEHSCFPRGVHKNGARDYSLIGVSVRNVHVLFNEHPDKITAVRYAIVQAVIAKLGG